MKKFIPAEFEAYNVEGKMNKIVQLQTILDDPQSKSQFGESEKVWIEGNMDIIKRRFNESDLVEFPKNWMKISEPNFNQRFIVIIPPMRKVEMAMWGILKDLIAKEYARQVELLKQGRDVEIIVPMEKVLPTLVNRYTFDLGTHYAYHKSLKEELGNLPSEVQTVYDEMRRKRYERLAQLEKSMEDTKREFLRYFGTLTNGDILDRQKIAAPLEDPLSEQLRRIFPNWEPGILDYSMIVDFLKRNRVVNTMERASLEYDEAYARNAAKKGYYMWKYHDMRKRRKYDMTRAVDSLQEMLTERFGQDVFKVEGNETIWEITVFLTQKGLMRMPDNK